MRSQIGDGTVTRVVELAPESPGIFVIPAAAAATRREVLARGSAGGYLVIGTHFAGKTAGKLVKDGDAYRFVA